MWKNKKRNTQVCVVCLDTERKLYLMREHGLDKLYEGLTGFSLCIDNYLPRTICAECSQRLVTCSQFKDGLLRARSMLLKLLKNENAMTTKNIQMLSDENKQLKLNLTKKNLESDHYVEEEEDRMREEEEDREESSNGVDINYEEPNSDDGSDDNMSHGYTSEDSLSADFYSLSRKSSTRHSQKTDIKDKNNKKVEEILREDTDNSTKINNERNIVATKNHNSNNTNKYAHRNMKSSDETPKEHNESNKNEDIGEIASRKKRSIVGNDQANTENSLKQMTTPVTVKLVDIFKDKINDHIHSKKLDENKRKRKGKVTHKKQKMLYTCDICSEKLTEKRVLIEHIKAHTNEKSNRFVCNMCPYVFENESQLVKHMTKHTRGKPLVCKYCQYVSKYNSTFVRHIRIHTGEKPYTCDQCGSKFALHSQLTKHIKTHASEKQYACHYCLYRTNSSYTLQRHIKIHTGEKNYSCKFCSYKAITNSTLKIHLRIHSGEKPYACQLCAFKAASFSGLWQHMRFHTGEKQFSCRICGYKGISKSVIQIHMRSHTGEKSFKCDLCQYTCARKDNLIKHIKKLHK